MAAGAACVQQGDGTRFSAPSNVFKPAKVEATPERMRGIKAPPGFTVTPFATGLKNARIITARGTPMVLGYTAHAAPMQMVFGYRGGFPTEYSGDAFVTMRGSWNRAQASGYEIVRVRFARARSAWPGPGTARC
ncbi:hypothetical protein JN27_03980 [Massilia sp. BSC265]|nr:hypothetical protein JN27_03980 [Massilia sp. BSC265]